jgi:hypothetical protein
MIIGQARDSADHTGAPGCRVTLCYFLRLLAVASYIELWVGFLVSQTDGHLVRDWDWD